MKRWTNTELNSVREQAVDWFHQYGRPLPWRSTSDPYCIWVSEIMLQQTVVAAVIPYYYKFLDTFPNVLTLANADEQLVLQHWAGLGYYRRARQLHAAAKVIRDTFDGSFPNNFQEVLDLPGVGRYTAGAILSFAFDQRHPIVEANTQRLYARLLRLPGQLTDSAIQKALWNFAESFLPDGPGSGETNQAMMELGSQVCTPKTPNCDDCPLARLCPTFRHKEQELIPTPKPARVYEEKREAVLILQNSKQQFLMRRCDQGERWAGLWDFPRFDVTDCKTESDLQNELRNQLTMRYGFDYQLHGESTPIKHGVTRYKITLRCFHGVIRLAERVSETQPAEQILSETKPIEQKWCSLTEVCDLPLSSTGKKLLLRLRESDAPKPKRIAHHKDTRKAHRQGT